MSSVNVVRHACVIIIFVIFHNFPTETRIAMNYRRVYVQEEDVLNNKSSVAIRSILECMVVCQFTPPCQSVFYKDQGCVLNDGSFDFSTFGIYDNNAPGRISYAAPLHTFITMETTVSTNTANSGSCDSFTKYPGMYLDKTMYAWFFAVGVEECKSACLDVPNDACLSIDFEWTSGLCATHIYSKDTHPHEFKSDMYIDYYHRYC